MTVGNTCKSGLKVIPCKHRHQLHGTDTAKTLHYMVQNCYTWRTAISNTLHSVMERLALPVPFGSMLHMPVQLRNLACLSQIRFNMRDSRQAAC